MRIILISVGIILCFILTFLKFRKNSKMKRVLEFGIIKKNKFLFMKGEESEIIKNITYKIENNTPKDFNLQIDFKKLQNAGLFDGRSIYKIFVNEWSFKTKKELFVLNKLQKTSNFCAIILIYNDFKQKHYFKYFTNLKFINLNDFNPELLFELNKININYPNQFEKIEEGIFVNNEKVDFLQYKNYRLESNYVTQNLIVKTYNILDETNLQSIFDLKDCPVCKIISFKNESLKNQNVFVRINIKISNEFCNIKKFNNQLVIKYFDNTQQKIYFFENNFQFFIKKYKKNVFLSVIFNKFKILSQSNLNLFICPNDIKIENLKNKLLKNFCAIKQILRLNFKSNCEKLNNFINNDLPNIFCKQYLNCSSTSNINFEKIKTIEAFEKLKKYKLNAFSFANFLFTKFLGISFVDNLIKISPNSNIDYFTFELPLNNQNYLIKYQNSGKKYISYGGLEFVNLNNINLKYINDSVITFCS